MVRVILELQKKFIILEPTLFESIDICDDIVTFSSFNNNLMTLIGAFETRDKT